MKGAEGEDGHYVERKGQLNIVSGRTMCMELGNLIKHKELHGSDRNERN